MSPRRQETPEELKARGNASYGEGKFHDAIVSYEAAVKVCGPDEKLLITLHSNLAMCHYQERNYDACLSHCNLAIAKDPKHVKSLLRRALAYEAMEKLSSALSDFRTVFEVDPGNRQAYEGISRVQRAQRLREKTIDAERRGVHPNANSKPAMTTTERAQKVLEHKNAGNAYFARGENQQAVKYYSLGLDLDDRNHVLFSNRSAAYVNLGQFDKALADAERVTELKADWPKGWYRKGLAHFKMGQYMQAMGALGRSLELDPGNSTVQDLLRQARVKT